MLFPELKQAKAKILVVEDSPDVQRYLRILLEVDRYQVEIASSGEEALQRLRDGSTPAVVLLDMQMPGMDGLETLQCLSHLRPDLKVIMCSGVDDPDKIRESISLGAQAYLVKPIYQLYLSAAIDQCLAAKPAGQVNREVRESVIVLPPADLSSSN